MQKVTPCNHKYFISKKKKYDHTLVILYLILYYPFVPYSILGNLLLQ